MVRNVPSLLPLTEIGEVCRKFGVKELAVFGSVLRDDFSPGSDVDFLITFENDDPGPWGRKYTQIQDDLSSLLSRRVDIVPRRAIERSRNWIRRKSILDSAVVVYGP
ncbi:MAG: nucleotidyltransferase domain-containing protein [Planctomycetes bacterium]|nr:nucleotidyltransferase domain-containing protein [Planctomycetota bacterium]MBI3833754.1 nucleotidyltransferase domain-containing protein [Planctomycetota bacterium]